MKRQVQKDEPEDGAFRQWHQNGQLAAEKFYKGNLLNGVCRQWNQDGKLLGKFKIKNGTGLNLEWHDNGQIKSEVSLVKGAITGRMRIWDADGMFITQSFFYENRSISKKRYIELCNSDPSLPRFADEKIANTFGNYLRRLRKARREQAKLGPTPEQIAEDKYFDEESEAEAKATNAKEIISWIQKGARGKRELGEMSRGEALNLARRLYALGAVKAWATGIERDSDGCEYSKRLIVALPNDKDAQAKIWSLCSDPAQPFLSIRSPAITFGQRYMNVSLL